MRARVQTKSSNPKWVLKYLTFAYVLLFVASFVAGTLLEIFQGTAWAEFGCHVRTTLIAGAQCKGFDGAEAVEFVLNLPVLLFYAPLFGVSGLIEGPFVLRPCLFWGLVWGFGRPSPTRFGM